MPEYGASISFAITVRTTPGSGFMPNAFSAITCVWPPPTRTICVDAGPACIRATPRQGASEMRARWTSVQLDGIDADVPAARIEEADIVEDHAIDRHFVDALLQPCLGHEIDQRAAARRRLGVLFRL